MNGANLGVCEIIARHNARGIFEGALELLDAKAMDCAALNDLLHALFVLVARNLLPLPLWSVAMVAADSARVFVEHFAILELCDKRFLCKSGREKQR